MTSNTFNDGALDWLRRQIGASSARLDITPLQGATSSSVYTVEAVNDTRRYVLRVLDNEDWVEEEPDLAAHEAAALEQACQLDLRAPRLVAYSNWHESFGAPVVLMTFLEGKIELRPADFGAWLSGLARELASIHAHAVPGFAWAFRTWTCLPELAVPQWTGVPDLWRRAIDIVRELAAQPLVEDECVFIHRDFHAVNVLWEGGAVSGVVDWINACRGPASVDVAHCRTDLALAFGPRAAQDFLDRYIGFSSGFSPGFEHDWRRDLDSILDMCLPEPSFYEPWRTFGLDAIDQSVLQQRIDALLAEVMSRL